MKKAILLLIAIACVQSGCRTYTIAEKDDDRILVGDLPDIGPLSIVLSHLFHNPSDYLLSFGNPISRIYVVKETEGTGFVSQDQLSSEIGDWNLDLAKLNQEYVKLESSKYTIPNGFSDERVVMVTDEELERLWSDHAFYNQEARYTDKIYVRFLPPIHFDDYCLVRFWIGPTAHGGTLTFLLKKTDRSWEIARKKLSYYL